MALDRLRASMAASTTVILCAGSWSWAATCGAVVPEGGVAWVAGVAWGVLVDADTVSAAMNCRRCCRRSWAILSGSVAEMAWISSRICLWRIVSCS